MGYIEDMVSWGATMKSIDSEAAARLRRRTQEVADYDDYYRIVLTYRAESRYFQDIAKARYLKEQWDMENGPFWKRWYLKTLRGIYD